MAEEIHRGRFYPGVVEVCRPAVEVGRRAEAEDDYRAWVAVR